MDNPGAPQSASRQWTYLHPKRPSQRRRPAWTPSSFGLLVPAEALAHRREDFLRKRMFLPRAKARVERGREDICRHRLLDRRHQGPAAFAGVRHMPRVGGEVTLL